MEKFAGLVSGRKEWLMSRVFYYIKEKGYLKYTSVLLAAWKISTDDLHDAFLAAVQNGRQIPELCPDEEPDQDQLARLGHKEAQRYYQRGVRISILFGLLKYYRQSFVDLINEAAFEPDYAEKCRRNVDRFFDRLEIGYCAGWAVAAALSGVVESPKPIGSERGSPESGQPNKTPAGAEGTPATEAAGLCGIREMLRIILQSSQQAIIELAADGRITGWNAAAERLFGWPGVEARGKDYRFLNGDEAGRLGELYRRSLRGEAVDNAEISLKRQDGTIAFARFTAVPVGGGCGAPDGVVSLFTDITELKAKEKELADSREKLFAAFGNMDGSGNLRKIVIELK